MTEPTDNVTPRPSDEELEQEELEDGEEQGGTDEQGEQDEQDKNGAPLGDELGTPLGEDVETTVNLVGDSGEEVPLRDDFDLDALTASLEEEEEEDDSGDHEPLGDESRAHLKGLLEALVFASDKPLRASELARLAQAALKEVKALLLVIKEEYGPRGLKLAEVAGGFVFHTDPKYALAVRDLTKAKPVKLSRAQIETLAILAYRQPITRPEIDEIRGVDCGAVLKMLLERDLIRILGKKDEPGRPLLYGTTPAFLEFFGLKSLKDLPTLHEFTELNEESRKVVEKELGEVIPTPLEETFAASAVTKQEIAPKPGAEAATETESDADAAPEAEGELEPEQEPGEKQEEQEPGEKQEEQEEQDSVWEHEITDPDAVLDSKLEDDEQEGDEQDDDD